jgi:SpoVK/Ycf46/Vps4 family AAA+-type ATPase
MNRIKLKDLNHSLLEEDIQHLAAVTHAYVGADLAALCQEAAMCALRRVVTQRQCPDGACVSPSPRTPARPELPLPSPPDLLKVSFPYSHRYMLTLPHAHGVL